MLDGDGTGPVNNLCFPSQVAPGYAPAGATLVAASVGGAAASDAGHAALERAARADGGLVRRRGAGWRHLRTVYVRHAQPEQRPGALEPAERPVRLESGVFVCGDHRDTASIHGALGSGRRAADAVRPIRSNAQPGRSLS